MAFRNAGTRNQTRLWALSKLGRLSSAQTFANRFHTIERIEYSDVADAQEHPEMPSKCYFVAGLRLAEPRDYDIMAVRL